MGRPKLSEEHHAAVAAAYREALAAGRPPVLAVAERFGRSRNTAGQWVVSARRAGALGPARGTRAGELGRDEPVVRSPLLDWTDRDGQPWLVQLTLSGGQIVQLSVHPAPGNGGRLTSTVMRQLPLQELRARALAA